MDTLLRLGADVNVQNKLGQTCLHLLATCDRIGGMDARSVHAIIAAGAQPGLQDRHGMTVWLLAVANNREPLVSVLLEESPTQWCPPNARCPLDGKTPLHLACNPTGGCPLVEKLLSHGADPLLIDDAGNTLLHEAATFFGGSQAEISLIERLIELGIPVDAGNIRGQTAAHLAGPVIPTDPNRRLYERCTRRTPISDLSQLGCSFDPNARDMNGFTPLHYACVASESIAFDLLRAGADVKCEMQLLPDTAALHSSWPSTWDNSDATPSLDGMGS
jgi:ankyrin repeat protein